MKLSRILGIMLAVSIMATAFIGCGNQQGSSGAAGDTQGTQAAGTTAATEAGKPVTITWFNHFQEKGIQNWISWVVEQMKTQYPTITVTPEAVSADQYPQMLRTKIAADDAPEFFDLSSYTDLVEFSSAGHLLDLTGIDFISNVQESVLPAGQVNGKQYGVPPDQNAIAVHYNKDLFDQNGLQVPKTTDELKAVCDKLAAAGIAPFACGFKEQWTLRNHFDPLNYQLIVSKDADWYKKKMDLSGKFADDQVFKDIFAQIYALKPYFSKDPFGTDWNGAMSMLATGKAAMILNGTWTLDGVSSTNPDAKIRIFAMPCSNNPDDTRIMMSAGASYTLFNSSDPAQVDAGKKLMGVVFSPESGQQYATTAKKISAIKGVNLDFSDAIKDVQAYMNDGKVVSSAGVTIFTNEYNTTFLNDLTYYLLQDKMDTDGFAKKLDADFAAAKK